MPLWIEPILKNIWSPASSFVVGYFAGRWKERHELVNQVVEKYVALPEPREGPASGLDRLSMLQRCGAGQLSKFELSKASKPGSNSWREV